jgi:hypothetical protein
VGRCRQDCHPFVEKISKVTAAEKSNAELIMSTNLKPYETITDIVTGKKIPNVGAEENRQAVERFLIEEKGYSKKDIEVDVDIKLIVAGEPYHSQVDLVVSADGGKTRVMAIKCAAASLGSREREILATARLLNDYQIPFAVVSDGKTATVLDTVTGKKAGEGLDSISSKDEVLKMKDSLKCIPLPKKRLEREKLIFRTYDSMNVNVQRNIPS